MEVLRNLFGTVTSGIVRLAVTVGIIVALYFFLVKPILDTAKETTPEIRKSLEVIFNQSFREDLRDLGPGIKQDVRKSLRAAKAEGDPMRMVRCVTRANGNVERIKRCTVKF